MEKTKELFLSEQVMLASGLMDRAEGQILVLDLNTQPFIADLTF